MMVEVASCFHEGVEKMLEGEGEGEEREGVSLTAVFRAMKGVNKIDRKDVHVRWGNS